MFHKLQNKWKVSAGRLLLIIATFALGGSACGYIGRKIMGCTSLDQGVLWVVVYIFIVTILWPICVILISIPLGQFTFFKKYLRNMISKLMGKTKKNSHIKNQNTNSPVS